MNEKINKLKRQTDIVDQSLSYHFRGVQEKWNIDDLPPFMNEFLNDVEKLVELTSDLDVKE